MDSTQQLTQQQAVQTLVNAVNLALQRGAFKDFNETQLIGNAISVFTPKATAETTQTTETIEPNVIE